MPRSTPDPGAVRPPSGEFDLIARHFRWPHSRADVVLGVGDDAALLAAPAGHCIAVSTDTLVCGVHFPPTLAAADIGHRALAVNLSDMAAMGAAPAWMTLALTIPAVNDAWLGGFAKGMRVLADSHGLALVGGNLSCGPLSVTVTVHGLLPDGQALRRDGARIGDAIYVSGTLGDARLALDWLERWHALPAAHATFLFERYARPQPRVALGIGLRGVASSCIDLSDGLAADLGHLLAASGVGAEVDSRALPLSAALRDLVETDTAVRYALTGGDDYELCFTVPATATARLPVPGSIALTRVGHVTASAGLLCRAPDGTVMPIGNPGYAHF